MAIATAYGCVAGANNVQQVLGGVAATGELRKISDGTLVATAEGFVGEDEPVWFGGMKQVRDKTSETGWAMRDMLPRRCTPSAPWLRPAQSAASADRHSPTLSS
jgi:hypothetical protein